MRQLMVCLCLASAALNAPTAAARPEPAPAPPPAAPSEHAIDAEPEHAWSCSLALAVYIVPDSHEYVQPTFKADLDALHLEARYNYEDLDTASLFIGWNFSFGDELTLELTPMIGAVFGETSGVAPGLEATLAWRQLELYTEAEYVFDSSDNDDNFFYMWTELSWYPVETFRIGAVAQRTRAYHSDADVERGLLLGISFENIDFAAYAFEFWQSDPTYVFSVTVNF